MSDLRIIASDAVLAQSELLGELVTQYQAEIAQKDALIRQLAVSSAAYSGLMNELTALAETVRKMGAQELLPDFDHVAAEVKRLSAWPSRTGSSGAPPTSPT